MKISIIIPVFNEEKTIYEILSRINKVDKFEKEVIVIDDGSTDDSKKIVKESCSGFISHHIVLDKNYGKGYACRKGIEKSSGDIILIQDADLEYNPENYIDLINPIIEGKAKVVYGSRVLPGRQQIRPKNLIIRLSKIANHFLTFLSNLLNNQKLTDAHTCYKVVSSDVMKKIELQENGFNFCPELTAKISKLNIKIYEVSIDYYGRSHKEGKKINILDGVRAIIACIRYNL